jgi:pyruvate dehydrogenase E1 component
MYRQFGIFSQVGQLYQPEDANQLMYYREDRNGQILQEGINEPGAMASWIAAATSYSTSDTPMIPFYIYYSMFGLQRVGDLAWAAGDSRARCFLLGATAGRTTLNGEGLQQQAGHRHLLSSVIPNCVSYDPTFGYEVAVPATVQDAGHRRVRAIGLPMPATRFLRGRQSLCHADGVASAGRGRHHSSDDRRRSHPQARHRSR